jgi:Domain of unknown function (DUF4388)
MAFQGYLSEHSLAKIFQFIQRGYRTGLLSIMTAQQGVARPPAPHYIWFQGGRIMAVARDLEHTGLLAMIKQRQLISFHDSLAWQGQMNSLEQPLGSQLHQTGILDAEQLRLLFHAQVIQPVCALFKMYDGEFYFDDKAPLVRSEMTGMSIAAAEAILLGLRVLRDWSFFSDQLPLAAMSFKKLRSDVPAFKLDTQELQVYELADGCVPIDRIAQEMDLPLLTIQKIGLRLMMIDLVREHIPEFTNLSVIVSPVMLNPPDQAAHRLSLLTTDFTGFLKKRG